MHRQKGTSNGRADLVDGTTNYLVPTRKTHSAVKILLSYDKLNKWSTNSGLTTVRRRFTLSMLARVALSTLPYGRIRHGVAEYRRTTYHLDVTNGGNAAYKQVYSDNGRPIWSDGQHVTFNLMYTKQRQHNLQSLALCGSRLCGRLT